MVPPTRIPPVSLALTPEQIAGLRLRKPTLVRAVEEIQAERRLALRVTANFSALASVDGSRDVPCTLIDVSGNGFLLRTDAGAMVGQRLVAHVNVIGTLDGRVTRVDGDEVHVEFGYGEAKRAKVAAMVEWLSRQDVAGLETRRRHDRSKPRNPTTSIEASGCRHGVRVIDASQSGAALATDAALATGDLVVFGEKRPLRARVVRAWEGGCAVGFLRLLPLEGVDPDDAF